jgi:hypothetical protein
VCGHKTFSGRAPEISSHPILREDEEEERGKMETWGTGPLSAFASTTSLHTLLWYSFLAIVKVIAIAAFGGSFTRARLLSSSAKKDFSNVHTHPPICLPYVYFIIIKISIFYNK